METAQLTVQKPNGNAKRQWTLEQKLAILQEWRSGIPAQELARRHSIANSMLWKWRRRLEKGLSDQGEMVPKSQLLAAQRRNEELERALGRKAMEVDVLKKVFETKGLRLPEGT